MSRTILKKKGALFVFHKDENGDKSGGNKQYIHLILKLKVIFIKILLE